MLFYNTRSFYIINYEIPNKISGALYHKVTTVIVSGRFNGVSIYRARPKSAIFNTPSLLIRMLAPFY